MDRIYQIEFNQYINAMDKEVYCKESDEYMNTPFPFLIREDEIGEMHKWGQGIKTLKFMGYLKKS